MTKITRRSFALGMLGAGVSASLIPDFATHAWAQDAAGEPVLGGTLTAITNNAPASLDPIYGNSAGADSRHYNAYVEPLIFMRPDGTTEPRLAESWEWSADGLELTLHLRSGVVFHDGTPFDAEAAKFNLDRARNPDINNNSAQFLTGIGSVDVVDPSTIKIVLTEPQASLLAALTAEAGYVVSPKAAQEMGENFTQSPVGTGPFKVTSWSSGVLEAEKFADYWGADDAGRKLPYLDKLVIRTQPNSAIKIVELKGGGAQILDTMQEKDSAQIEQDPTLILSTPPLGTCQYITFNNGKAPFDNLDLRKAFAYALNRDAIAKIVGGPNAKVVNGLGTDWSYSDDLKGPNFDLEAAKAAYVASGHSGPISLCLIQRDPDTQIAQIVQSMVKEVGIDLRIETLERTAYVEKTLSGNFEVGLQRVGLPVRDPDTNFGRFYARDAQQNYAQVNNEELFEIIDQTRVELDQAKRGELYIKAQQIILDDYNQVFLYLAPQRDARRAEVQNVKYDAGGAWEYRSIWLKA